MKAIQACAVFALMTSTFTLGAESALAQALTGSPVDNNPRTQLGDFRRLSLGYTVSSLASGTQAHDLIGADVKTASGENVGSVNDLIIGENGRIIAIVVGVTMPPRHQLDRGRHELEPRPRVRHF